jgi:polysaccharide export outer membrane protein
MLTTLLALFLQSSVPSVVNSYILGPEDQLLISVLDLDEIGGKDNKPIRIDTRGNIVLPVAGRIQAAGLTVEQLEKAIALRLKSVLQDPQPSVSVFEFRSQPVSVLGSVKTPGVHQIRGKKTLFEVLSLAGGLNPDAGYQIFITRAKKAGPLPLANAADDSSGTFRVASVSVRSVMDARNPMENIEVLPEDVISVPKADLVYVVGAVKKSGGFVLAEKEKISVLQALSLAEGLDRGSAANKSKILRAVPNSDTRIEIPVDLKLIMAGKKEDLGLRADDILFIPISGPKNAAMRGLEAAIQVGTGMAIYRR